MKRPNLSPRLVATLVAVLLGGVAFVAARHHLGAYERAAEQRVAERHRTVPVLVAREDLAAGTQLDPGRLATRAIPEPYVLSDAMRPDDLEAVVGRRLQHAAKAGEPIQRAALASDDAAFSSGLESGRRALTFPVDEVNAVSGMLVPGDVIDLLYTEARASGRLSVRPLLQNVTVLATGTMTRSAPTTNERDSREGARHFATITLEVTPEQAQWIVLAQRTGELTAVLRHPADRVAYAARAIDASDLHGERAVRASRTAEAEYVDVISGGSPGIARRQRLAVDAPAAPTAHELPPFSASNVAPAAAPPTPVAAAPSRDAGDAAQRLGVQARDTPASRGGRP